MLKEAKNKIWNQKESQQNKQGIKTQYKLANRDYGKNIFCNGYLISNIVIAKLKKKKKLKRFVTYLSLQVIDSI